MSEIDKQLKAINRSLTGLTGKSASEQQRIIADVNQKLDHLKPMIDKMNFTAQRDFSGAMQQIDSQLASFNKVSSIVSDGLDRAVGHTMDEEDQAAALVRQTQEQVAFEKDAANYRPNHQREIARLQAITTDLERMIGRNYAQQLPSVDDIDNMNPMQLQSWLTSEGILNPDEVSPSSVLDLSEDEIDAMPDEEFNQLLDAELGLDDVVNPPSPGSLLNLTEEEIDAKFNQRLEAELGLDKANITLENAETSMTSYLTTATEQFAITLKDIGEQANHHPSMSKDQRSELQKLLKKVQMNSPSYLVN